ncbi:MAG: MHS family MFS transporter [Proteobacteria bacterium]|jgi:metabolite-proton symporter|nr:MHS family MFS transporter [Pseudomonadota bacterium]
MAQGASTHAGSTGNPVVDRAEARRALRRVVIASVVGTTIEWYDFFLYGIVAGLVFNHLFFPETTPLMGTLLAYATFAVGFIARPLGGVIFGHFGDRIGRKSMLILTLMIMGVATFLIGLLPTYASLGVWASVLLLILRVLQGIGLGGEWGGSVLMAYEYAPPEKRGLYASLPQVGLSIGLCLGTGVVALVSLLPEAQFMSWGWRVAFLLSGILVFVGLYIRLRIFETPEFASVKAQHKEAKIPIVELFTHYKKNILLGMGARYIDGVCFNIYAVFAIGYLANQLHFPRTTALLGVTIASLVMIVFIPLFGSLSDRIGRSKVYGWGAVITGAAAFPSFWIFHNTVDPLWIWLAIVIPFGIVYAAVYGPEAALFAELFDTRVRYTGISFVYQFSGIFASGLTPLIATALLPLGDNQPWLICWYSLAVGLISAVSAYLIHNGRARAIPAAA